MFASYDNIVMVLFSERLQRIHDKYMFTNHYVIINHVALYTYNVIQLFQIVSAIIPIYILYFIARWKCMREVERTLRIIFILIGCENLLGANSYYLSICGRCFRPKLRHTQPHTQITNPSIIIYNDQDYVRRWLANYCICTYIQLLLLV